MTTRDLTATVVVALWIVSALASVGVTIAWFWRFHGTKASASVVFTAMAGAPGVTLLLESVVRLVERWGVQPMFLAEYVYSGAISCLWFVLGPLLLLIGLFLRGGHRDAPRGTTIVQLLHAVMWGWSTFIGLLMAASI